MNDEKPLILSGPCFHNGREFVAKLECQEGNRKVMKTLGGDPHLTALLEEAFNFLLSGDTERIIAGYMNTKRYTESGLPYVAITVGGVKYGLVAAKNNPNSGRIIVQMPFFGSQASNSFVSEEFSESDADNYDMVQAGAAASE